MQDVKNKCFESTTQNPLVSVIVPVYKVEKYIEKCIDSILRQSYKNLQIILVDDGSPDNCGSICDEYAIIDERISVIHQKNQGIAGARNSGLKVVQGEWIAWVDSDDWVEPDFIAGMLSEALSHNADIVICGRSEEYKNRSKKCGVREKTTLDPEHATILLLEDKAIRSYMCDKLWRSDLFKGVSFPVGYSYEDIAVCYKLFLKAKYIVCIPKAYYHYIIRSESITNSGNAKDNLYWSIFTVERNNCLAQRFPACKTKLEKGQIRAVIGIWGNSYRNGILFNKNIKDRLKPISEHF